MIAPLLSANLNEERSASWRYFNPVSVHCGPATRRILLSMIRHERVLIVSSVRGRQHFESDKVLVDLLAQNSVNWVDTVTENPSLSELQTEIDLIGAQKVDALIAFGGGSAMDAAKALRGALSFGGKGPKLAELISNPALLDASALPRLYAVPTTAGTGSEVTPFATVWDKERKRKLSLSGESLFPTSAIVDSQLMQTLPLNVTVATGLDAINQAFESVWNKNANSITLGYAGRSLALSLRALPILARGEGGEQDRAAMAEASLLAGLAISHTRTALCHSISYPLTAHFGVPHGLACAFTMPAVLRLNLSANDGRFDELALRLTGSSVPTTLIAIVEHLCTTLQVRRLVQEKVPSLEALLALKGEMLSPGRADNNLNDSVDLHEILTASWQFPSAP